MPVPWEIEYYHREPRALVTPASDGRGRCRWVPDNDHYPERDAQFHILNAAEDLLEACETFLKAYEEASSELHFGQALDSAFADVLEPMYAAIAKARVERND